MPDDEQTEGDAGDLGELGYEDALGELESILADLDDAQLDIDVLAEKVRRAATLLRLCNDRVASARMEVEQVVAELDTSDEG
jgi:exodeoxyribonuclease VII small subunit